MLRFSLNALDRNVIYTRIYSLTVC